MGHIVSRLGIESDVDDFVYFFNVLAERPYGETQVKVPKGKSTAARSTCRHRPQLSESEGTNPQSDIVRQLRDEVTLCSNITRLNGQFQGPSPP